MLDRRPHPMPMLGKWNQLVRKKGHYILNALVTRWPHLEIVTFYLLESPLIIDQWNIVGYGQMFICAFMSLCINLTCRTFWSWVLSSLPHLQIIWEFSLCNFITVPWYIIFIIRDLRSYRLMTGIFGCTCERWTHLLWRFPINHFQTLS